MLLAEPSPTRADLGLRVLGFPVRVAPWFWLMGLGLGWHKGVTLETLLWWLAVSFLAILVHELGHAATARLFGATNGRIVLYHLGGLAISDGRLPRWKRVVELLMGPGAGFLLGGVAYLALWGLVDTLRPGAANALYQLVFVCLVWGAVNLLPVYPLDGGQVSLEVSTRFGPTGPLWALRGSLVTAVVVAVLFIGLWIRDRDFGLFAGLLFASLAVQNWIILKALAQGAVPPGGDDLMPHERQPWEKDPDYWRDR
jgi:stage IV sporulation protein FB